MSSRTSIAAAFAAWSLAGLRPPPGFEAAAARDLWAGMTDGDDGAIGTAARAWLDGPRGQWWPTLPEFRALLPRVERRAIAAGSPCPTYDALDQDQRAAIGEAILVEARDCIANDDALAAECERRARLVAA